MEKPSYSKTPFQPKASSTMMLSKNYVSSNIQPNYDSIDKIYSTFSAEDYESIKNVISGNEILNFRTKSGETLIHAVMINPSSSLNEAKIKEIIELLVHKNVPINAMNKFNQTALHLACKKGYYEIINYLVDLNCNKNIIDNDGNAPIHYIIDKFVEDCQSNEYFNYANAVINNENQLSNKEIKNINLCIQKKILDNTDIKKYFKNINKIVKSFLSFSENSLNNNILEITSESLKDITKDINDYFLNNTQIQTNYISDIINNKLENLIKNIEQNFFNNLSCSDIDIGNIQDVNKPLSDENNKLELNKYLASFKSTIKTVVSNLNNNFVQVYENMEEICYILYYILITLPANMIPPRIKIPDILKQFIAFNNNTFKSVQIKIQPPALPQITLQETDYYYIAWSTSIIYDSNDLNLTQEALNDPIFKQLVINCSLDGISCPITFKKKNYGQNQLYILTWVVSIGDNAYFFNYDMTVKLEKIYNYLLNPPVSVAITPKGFIKITDDVLFEYNLGTNEFNLIIIKGTTKYPLYRLKYDNTNYGIHTITNFGEEKSFNYNKKFNELNNLKYSIKKTIAECFISNVKCDLYMFSDKIHLESLNFDFGKNRKTSFEYTMDRNILDDGKGENIELSFSYSNIPIFSRDFEHERIIKGIFNNDDQDYKNLSITPKFSSKSSYDSQRYKINKINKKGVYEWDFQDYKPIVFDYLKKDANLDFFIDGYKAQLTYILELAKIIENLPDFKYNIVNPNYIFEFYKVYTSIEIIANILNNLVLLKDELNNRKQFFQKFTKNYEEIKNLLNEYTGKVNILLEEDAEIELQTQTLLSAIYKKYLEKIDFSLKNIYNKINFVSDNLNQIFVKLYNSEKILNNILEQFNIIQSKQFINKLDNDTRNLFFNNIKYISFDKNIKSFDDYYNLIKSSGNNIIKLLNNNNQINYNIFYGKPPESLLLNNITILNNFFNFKQNELVLKSEDYLNNNNFNTGLNAFYFLQNYNPPPPPLDVCKYFEKNPISINFELEQSEIPPIIFNSYKEYIQRYIVYVYNKLNQNNNIDSILDDCIKNINDYLKNENERNKVVGLLNFIKQNNEYKEKIILANLTKVFDMKINYHIVIVINQYINKIKNSDKGNILKIIPEIGKILSKKQLGEEDLKISLINKIKSGLPSLDLNLILKKINTNENNVLFFNKKVPGDNGKTKKLLNDKCINLNKMDYLRKLNVRIEDKNGNTVLNRLIDQYNVYAITKLLQIDPAVKTYKNGRDQNSSAYLIDLLRKIESQYKEENLNSRLEKYSFNLTNYLKNLNETYLLKNQDEVIKNIIKNCLYIFNEYLWFLLYQFFNGITLGDISKLKEIIGKINNILISDDNKLLIQNFDEQDKEELKNLVVDKESNGFYNDSVKEYQQKINNLKNQLTQYEEIKRKNLNLYSDIDDRIRKTDLEIYNLENELNNLQGKININMIKKKVDEDYDYIQRTNLVNNMEINYNEYDNLIRKIGKNYYDLISILNKKNKNNITLSKLEFLLILLEINKLDSVELDTITKYFNNFINKIYGDFNDLDKYEDAEYNYINYNMLKIIKMSISNIFAFEFINHLRIFLIKKLNSSSVPDKTIIGKIKSPQFSTKVYKNIINIFNNAIIDKLGLRNQDGEKDYPDNDTLVNGLINDVRSYLMYEQSFVEEVSTEIRQLCMYYNALVDNISLNTYDEMKMLLENLKKKSLLIEIYNLIKN